MIKISLLLILILVQDNTINAQNVVSDSSNVDSTFECAPFHELITRVAGRWGYNVKFFGKDKLDAKICGVRKNAGLLGSLELLANFPENSFGYFFRQDTIFIDYLYTYGIDSLETLSSFIRKEYDSARHGNVLKFQNISPLLVMDSLLVIDGRTPVNNLETREKVSGNIPYLMVDNYLFHKLTRFHHWALRNEKNTSVISAVKPQFYDVKDSYKIDTCKFSDSTYTIYTTLKRNNAHLLTFKRLPLPDLFKIIEKYNNYFITRAGYWGKPDLVTGTLPLELPLEIFARLICEKHHLVWGIYDQKKTLIFAKYKEDVEEWDGYYK